jgi:glycerol-3-phosphate acyltransferase PlsY
MQDAFGIAKTVAIVLGSYLLGCVATGYYLVRWRTGQDLRVVGSGSTGGTNAGRVLGRWGLVITGLVDILKGGGAVGAARYFGLDDWAVALTAGAVVAGHVFPFQLRFHGGRGLGTALGALLLIDWPLVALVLGLTGLFWLVSRRLTLSLMACVAAMPIFAFSLGRQPAEIWGLIPIALFILVAHRQKISGEVSSLRSRRQGP